MKCSVMKCKNIKQNKISQQAFDGPWEEVEPAAALAMILRMQKNKIQRNEMQLNNAL